MASSTPSRAKKQRSSQSGRRKAARASTVSKRAAKPRKSSARAAAKRAQPTTEISSSVRQEWQQLSQRWKSLLPKLANGGGAKARGSKQSAARA